MSRSVFSVALLAALLLGCAYGPAQQDGARKESALSEAPLDQGGRLAPILNEARKSILDGEFDKARELLVSGLAEDVDPPATERLLTLLELLDENYESAISLAAHRAKVEQGAVDAKLYKADAEFYLQDLDAATQSLREALEELNSPGLVRDSWCNPLSQCCVGKDVLDAEARVRLATVVYLSGDLDTAEEMAHEILNDHPDYAGAYFLLALISNRRDDIQGARRYYAKVLKQAACSSATWNNLGVLAFREHKLREARKKFKKALTFVGPDHRTTALVLTNIAEIDMLEGKLRRAEDRYLMAREVSWRYPGSYYGYAMLLALTGRDEQAVDEMRQGLRLDPKGLVESAYYFYSEEWKWFHEALKAEALGEHWAAKTYWRKILSGDEPRLKEVARRFLYKKPASQQPNAQ